MDSSATDSSPRRPARRAETILVVVGGLIVLLLVANFTLPKISWRVQDLRRQATARETIIRQRLNHEPRAVDEETRRKNDLLVFAAAGGGAVLLLAIGCLALRRRGKAI